MICLFRVRLEDEPEALSFADLSSPLRQQVRVLRLCAFGFTFICPLREQVRVLRLCDLAYTFICHLRQEMSALHMSAFA